MFCPLKSNHVPTRFYDELSQNFVNSAGDFDSTAKI